ncbi:hypothetical protein PAMP_006837 [Pampus punctatissimus]
MMTVWWCALILLCCTLSCVETSTSSLVVHRQKYNKSFSLTRVTRIHVHQLLKTYKKQLLGNQHVEDRCQQLKDLPPLSTDFYSWLQLTDWERLHTAFWDMRAYWNILEEKKRQLEREEKEHRAIPTTLPESIKNIQLDLRDLMSQVSSQMSYMKASWVTPASTTVWTPLNPETNSKTVWDSRVEGYIILRNLDLYLTKLARDFLLLASKTHL